MPNRMNFDNWEFIATSAAFGALAGIVRAFRAGVSFRAAFLQAAVAFILCVACGSALMQWTSANLHVIFGVCGLIGLCSDQVLTGVERMWAAFFNRAEDTIGGENADDKPAPSETSTKP